MNPRVRQSAYLIGTIATGIITLASVWNGISGEAATSLSNAITALLGLLGLGAGATATAVISRQRKEGVLDTLSPADQAINGIQATIQQAQSAASDIERIKDAASQAVRSVPVVGPLAQQIIDSIKLK